VETSNYQDLRGVHLADTAALPGGEECLAIYNEWCPLLSDGPGEVVRVDFESFYGI
jgi:hypothetical protein